MSATLMENLYLIESCKSDIKSAIEAKGVDMTSASLPDYASKIGEIQTGGTFVTEVLSVSQNGTYYPGTGVDGFSQVDVNVPQSVSGITEKDFTQNTVVIENLYNSASFVYQDKFNGSSVRTVDLPQCTLIDTAGFCNCRVLSTVNLPVCVSLKNTAFQSCYNLSSISLPACEYIGYATFSDCRSLTRIDLPNVLSMSGAPFVNCWNLSEISLPECGWISNNTFSSCYNLTRLVLPKCWHLGNYVFTNCSNLSEIILGYSSVCETGLFTVTNFTGVFYVPASLLEDYKVASIWSDYSSRIFAIPE